MKLYKNLSGNSPVVSYEYDVTTMRIQFESGQVYEYDAANLGAVALNEMKRLADSGKGLSAYINHNRKIYHGYSGKA